MLLKTLCFKWFFKWFFNGLAIFKWFFNGFLMVLNGFLMEIREKVFPLKRRNVRR